MLPNDHLSPHFTYGEMTRTSVRGLINEPGSADLPKLIALCNFILEPVRRNFGPVIIHSGYRSPMVNDKVGGARASQHVRCEAADFHVVGVDHYTVAKWIAAHLPFDQMILEFVDPTGFGGWVHCSYVDYRDVRSEILRAYTSPMGTRYQKLTAGTIPDAVK